MAGRNVRADLLASRARALCGDLHGRRQQRLRWTGVGSYGHYQQDVDQFASWGFDAIKVDFCGAGQEWLDQPPNDPRTLYGQFSQSGGCRSAPDDPKRLQLLDAGADQRDGSLIRGLFLGQLLVGAGGRAELADRHRYRLHRKHSVQVGLTEPRPGLDPISEHPGRRRALPGLPGSDGVTGTIPTISVLGSG